MKVSYLAEEIHLKMKDWFIEVPSDFNIGFEGENEARKLIIEANVPTNINYKLEVERSKQKDIIDLTQEGRALVVVLKEEMLGSSGFVSLQVRGVDGARVYKSNKFTARVLGSINAVSSFEKGVPSEFTQLENRVTEAVKMVEGMVKRPPVLGEDGYWLLWSQEEQQYIRSEYKAIIDSSGEEEMDKRLLEVIGTGDLLN